MKRIYFDYAASTPLRSEVEKAMKPYFTKQFGNPSSLHFFGQEGIAAIDRARTVVAKNIGAAFREVIFTGSATEANNFALRGVVRGARGIIARPRIIISAIEHESILETARDLERDGAELIIIPVDSRGVVDVRRLEQALNERTVVVSVMYVNNEIGTVQPIQKIAHAISKFKKGTQYPLFHTDAVQAFNYFECDVNELGVDMMTLSGHKIGGPKGVGALYVKHIESANKKILTPILTGGGQEFGLRSGTENVPGIVGFAEAVVRAAMERQKERARLLSIKKYFWKEMKRMFPDASIYGMDEKHFGDASPHIVNISLRNMPLDDLIVRLDVMGISASSGSACASRAATHSHVLLALFENASRGVRFSFGRGTTRAEMTEAIKRIHRAFTA